MGGIVRGRGSFSLPRDPFQAILATALIVVVVACGEAAAPTPPASSGGAVDPSALPSEANGAEPDHLQAAIDAELALSNDLRDATGVVAALGPSAEVLLRALDDAEGAFGEAARDEMLAALAAPADYPGAGAVLAGFHPTRTNERSLDADGGTGSFGAAATSFLVNFVLAIAPELIDRASSPNFQQQTASKTETKDFRSDDATEHMTFTQRYTVGIGQGRVVLDVVLTSDSMITNTSTGATIAQVTSSAHGVFEIDGCPAPDGISEGRYTLEKEYGSTTPGGGPSATASSSADGAFRVFNGDDARLIRTEIPAALKVGARGTRLTSAGDSTEAFDWDAEATYPVTVPARGRPSVGQGNVESNNASPTNVALLDLMAVMAGEYLSTTSRAAETFWRSGACIDLKTTERDRMVEPDEAITIDVNPLHKFDGAQVDAPVTATFTGMKSLEPVNTPVDPPVSFDFVAGHEPDDRGVVDMIQTSRRGIGKLRLSYAVGSRTLHATYDGRYQFGGSNQLWTIRFLIDDTILTRDADGAFTNDTTLEISGDVHVSNPGRCEGDASFNAAVDVDVRAVIDEADPALARLTIKVAPTSEQVSLVCSGAGGSVTVETPLSDHINVWKVPLGDPTLQAVDVTIGGSPTIVNDSYAPIGQSTTTVTVTDPSQ